MKNRWIRAGILAAIFIVAVAGFSLLTNRGTDDRTVDMGAATLPRISFVVEDYAVNYLVGYVNEMDITAMRDTITPAAGNGTLTMQLEKYENKIDHIAYEIYSLDGETLIAEGDAREEEGRAVLSIGNEIADVDESVLKVTLHMGEKEVYYYTRVEKMEDLSTKECIAFAQDFHSKTFNKGSVSQLSTYLEPNAQGDNTTFDTVTIHSDSNHIMWGNLAPEVCSNVEWSIKENNSSYTSLLAQYQVNATGDTGEIETYNIREFFRIRYAEGEIYLLDYNRTMNQLFDENKQVLSDEGILLGITCLDVSYETNKDGTIVSFVQGQDLWNYNQEADELSLVFSFSNTEGNDVRNRYDQHGVRIISMDENGSTVFAVYGYMNRGAHEGEVGVNVFYYDIQKNALEEKAFIPSDKSFAIAEDELGKMVYYSSSQDMLYVLTGGTLYRVNLGENKQEVLQENLEEGQYVVSADGHLLAHQSNGTATSATKAHVMNLQSGKEWEVQVADDECIRPLGFVFNDFVYGIAKQGDLGTTVAGESILPMYILEIRDSKNEVAKTYTADQIYVSDVFIEDNMITLNRVTKNGDVYTGTSQDYITNNEEKLESNISLETFSTDTKERQMRITYAEGISDKSPKILQPKLVLYENPQTISFHTKNETTKYYVYGMGELAAVYDRAGYAIQKAESISGVVISSDQAYVWERGNRNLVYDTGVGAFTAEEGQTSLAACEALMETYDAERVNLTGCTLEQVLYVINKGLPVIAMTDAANAILLTGYDTATVTYVNPSSGEVRTESIDAVSAMAAGSGNTFIGYIQ